MELLEREFDDGGLVIRIINLEISWKAEARGFPAQQPGTERVESADPGVVKSKSLADQEVADPLFHLRGCLVCESYSQNRASWNSLLDQMGNSIGDGACFARARARQDQHRAFESCCRFALSGIQFVKESHFAEWAR